MDTYIQSQAWQVRMALESQAPGDITAPAVQNLISALGGDSNFPQQASLAGNSHLVGIYLVALLLTQPQG